MMPNKYNLRPFNPAEISRSKTRKLLRSSVIIPSQQQAYGVCTEIMLDWFLSKFEDNFFNSVYVDGAHSFDEFRKLSTINEQYKRTNPIMAMVPSIDSSHNREWIDSSPELPMMLRRSRLEGVFLSDVEHNKGLHLQATFKSIKMNFLYRVRLDTRGEELDMFEFIKIKHRAGWSETLRKDMDIHIPKDIIKQIAFDNGFAMKENGEPAYPLELLNYLNSHSLIPFMYKLRCTTGNTEYFIKVPNCVVHIKSELPTMDDGERQNMVMSNYNVEFPVEVEMTAPYCFTYYSEKPTHNYINNNTFNKNEYVIALMQSTLTDIPMEDKNHWPVLTVTEYGVDNCDLNKPLEIDFKDIFCGTDISMVLDYTQKIALSPAIFLNFIFFNDSRELEYTMDWDNMVARIENGIKNERTVIGIYTNIKYINDTIINIKELDKRSDRV